MVFLMSCYFSASFMAIFSSVVCTTLEAPFLDRFLGLADELEFMLALLLSIVVWVLFRLDFIIIISTNTGATKAGPTAAILVYSISEVRAGVRAEVRVRPKLTTIEWQGRPVSVSVLVSVSQPA